MLSAAISNCLVGAIGIWLIANKGAYVTLPIIPKFANFPGVSHSLGRKLALIPIALLITVITTLIVHKILGVFIVSLVAGATASCAPFVVASRAVRQQERARRDAWPEAVEQLVSCIRSGESLPASINFLATRGPERLREQFQRVVEHYRATGDFAASLEVVSNTSITDVVGTRVASALSLAHEVGGRELVRVLRALAELVREDQLLRKEIAARQSWTISGARAAAAAPWVILALFAARPSTLAAFQTPLGNAIIAGGALATIIGYRTMLYLGRIGGRRP